MFERCHDQSPKDLNLTEGVLGSEGARVSHQLAFRR
jgi:hypothetical protein